MRIISQSGAGQKLKTAEPNRSLHPRQAPLAPPVYKPGVVAARIQPKPRDAAPKQTKAFARQTAPSSPSALQADFAHGAKFRFPSSVAVLPNQSSAAQEKKGSTPRTLQTKLAPGVEAFPVNLQQRPGGWTLPREVQSKMEKALEADFSDVRVHVGSEVSAIGAIAFTWGSNIHFAPGYYNPHTPHGQQLLAHELTHVLQQRAGRVHNPFGNGVAVVQDEALEAEADRMGQKAAMSLART